MNVTVRRWPAFVAAAAPLAAVPAAIAADAPAGETDLEEVIVTGSRIQQRLEDSPVPVIVMDREAIERASQDSIGKVLQQLPINTGFAQNTNMNNGGDGTVRINLRGLGAERTLVLVNGRRVVYGGNGGDASVDVNVIPLSVVERVEVMGVGSSTIYGADAIGGVVNMITREDYNGAELSGSYTTSEHGDGTVYDLAFVAGSSSDRAYLTFGAELVDQHEVFQGDREYSERTEFITSDGGIGYGGSPAIPQGYFRIPGNNTLGLARGEYTRVDGSGNPPTAADFRTFQRPDDLYDYAPINYLQTPSKRQYLWLVGGYDVSDSLSFFLQAILHHRDSERLLAPTPFNSLDIAGGAYIFPEGSPHEGEPGIPADNYYNPFGVDLVFPNRVRRRFVESVGRRYSDDVNTQWYVAGARGTIGDTTWNWEVSADYGRNDSNVTTEGEFRADHLRNATGPSGPDASGNIVCGKPDPVTGIVPAASVIAGCVPINLFGGLGPDGKGTITRDMLDYATATLTDQGYNEQQIYELIFRGDWGAIQERPVSWAVGATYRNESAQAKPDAAKVAGTAGAITTNLARAGNFSVTEAYAEAAVPLLRDLPAAQELNLTAGLRFSDFSSFGSVTTYQGGLMYRPMRALTLRGAYGTVFRAPPIVDLYTANTTITTGAYDPCGNGPTPEQMVNCAAAGVPGGSYVQDEDDEFFGVVGGNPDLQPEEGYSATAGFTVTPPATPGLQFSADWWRTKIDNVIMAPFEDDWVVPCADAGTALACSKIQRFPDGSIAFMDLRNENAASATVSGVDMDVGYTRPLAGGTISMRATATYLIESDFLPVQGAATFHAAGLDFQGDTQPRWRGLGYVQYSRGPWSGSYQAQYIGAMDECGGDSNPLTWDGCRTIEDRWYQDVRLQFDMERGPSVALAINNITGADPPRVNFVPSGANTSMAAYPLLGRTYYLQLSYRIE